MISSIKFIDANIFIQRWYNPRVEKFINELDREQHCTSVLVLMEVCHKLQKKNITNALEYFRDIMGAIKVYDVLQDDFFNAIKNPVDINISDKIHLAVMKRNNIHTIISFDRDFDKDKTMVREEL